MTNYFEAAKATYLENWPQALCQLSIAQVDIPLSLEEARALGRNIIELGERFVSEGTDWKPPDVSGIRRRVEEAVGLFPNGAFVRLGSRSPKDAWSWRGPNPGKILTGDGDPLRYLLDCSERVADDLYLAIANNYPPHIFVREWVRIQDWAEFRCFMRRGKLVGVSQYVPRIHFPEVEKEHSIIRWGISNFFRDFRAACHLEDVVFDVYVKVRVVGNEGSIEVKLLEINPAGPWTDPCQFDNRREDDFDGTFRYIGQEGLVCRPL